MPVRIIKLPFFPVKRRPVDDEADDTNLPPGHITPPGSRGSGGSGAPAAPSGPIQEPDHTVEKHHPLVLV